MGIGASSAVDSRSESTTMWAPLAIASVTSPRTRSMAAASDLPPPATR